MISHSSQLFLIENENARIWFPGNCGLAFQNFLWVSSPGLHTLPWGKFVSFSQTYQGRVEFWVWVKLLHMKQLMALTTATSLRSFTILSSNSWWEMCSSGNRKRLVWPGGKCCSIRHAKFRKFKPEFLVKWNTPQEWYIYICGFETCFHVLNLTVIGEYYTIDLPESY